uniref:EpoF n=1 Tax=Sorangium cellulosum TaxID=56 RepID=Q9KIZ5_SORCE|nr:EpoF [Sorangium cellulosum]
MATTNAGKLEHALLLMDKLAKKNASLEQERTEPIAIIGIGCRFPGGADTPEAFWELLDSGRDAVQPLDRRWALVGVHPSEEVPRWAGLLTEAVDGFDAAFFGTSPREARSLDPQQRLLLEVTWEGLEDAGIAPQSLDGSRTGVFLGACSSDYSHTVAQQRREEQDAYDITGNTLSVAAGRLSYTLGLQGPCLTVDTACSSSLVAIHLACRSLRARESDLALAGGVNMLLSSKTMIMLGRIQALSPDGHCRTFDASANGFVRGEGCGMVVLKRLSDAQRHGDRIWALIRGSAMNQDGRSTGLMAPNVLAQEALLRQALQSARVDAGAIDYVETHGTGTSLGDPIEVDALRAVMGPARADGSRCVLGAVKTNLGHLEGAAGVAGLIKAALALHHESIPRNLHFHTLNPRIRIEGTALALATEPVPWPRAGRPRFAGVSAFGLSGTNVHVVLEEAPATVLAPATPGRSAELLVLSAKSTAALDAQAARLSAHIAAYPEQGLGDVAFSLVATRSPMEHRLAVAATSREALRSALEAAAQGQTPAGAARGRAASSPGKLAFLFAGQGAQVPGMGRGLWEAWPAFRETFDRCVTLFDRELHQPLCEVMWAEPGSSRSSLLDQTAFTQPALFALEYALAALFRSWGVEPELIAGHSLGELVAACVAGVFSLEDAVRLVVARGRLMQALPAGGAMVSIAAPEADVAAAVAPHAASVSIAAVNGPEQVVIAGAEKFVQQIAAAFAARGARTKPLHVSHAFHSPLMDPMLEAFRRVTESVTYRRPSMALVSNLSGKPCTDEVCAPGYWVRHAREAVRFADGVKALHAAGAGIFVEVGPKPALLGLLPACLPDARPVLLPASRAGRDEAASALEALGGFWVVGGSVTWSGVFPSGGRRVPLPTYPWQRERYWIEAPVDGEADGIGRAQAGDHPLLGEAFSVSTHAGLRLWETTLDRKRLPWLGEHRAQGEVVFPGAGYLEMALSSGAEILGDGPIQVTDVVLIETLTFAGDTAVPVQVVTTEERPGRLRFQVASREPGARRASFRIHARGVLRRVGRAETPARLNLAALRARLHAAVPAAAIYGALAEMGLQYGPALRGLAELWRGEGEALGRVRLPESAGSATAYQLHPVLLDACVQMIVGAFADRDEATPWAPVEVGSVRLFQRSPGELWCHARVVSDGQQAPSRWSADFELMDGTGAVVAEISRLVVERLASGVRRRDADDWFLELDWEPAALEGPKITAGRWLLLGEGGGLGRSLCSALKAAGHVVVHAAGDDTSAAGMRALLANAFDGQAPTAVVHLSSLDGGGQLDPGLGAQGALDAPRSPDVDADALESALMRGCDSVLSLVQALVGMDLRNAPRLWLLTRGAQAAAAGDVSVVQAPLLGLGRTIALEHAELRCISVDLDPAQPEGEADALLAELLADDAEEEVALRGGERFVARLVHRLPEAQRREKIAPAGDRPFRLEIDEPGVLDQLVLRATGRRAPGPGEVEIAVEAAGLDSIDIQLAVGVAPNDLPGGEIEPSVLGSECAGRIVAVGEGVNGLVVGQPVIALAAGVFATHVTTSATLVLPRPLGLSATEAAAMPLAYLTAWYALDKVAHLQAGERVLIRAEAGGIGLCAVRWAQRVGAEVYATADTPEKRAYLESLGVRYVSDSRSGRFAADVHAWTDGEGVDVVLDSLSGEHIDKSLMVLRACGRLVKLGRRDDCADTQPGLPPLLRNFSFSQVDLRGMMLDQPARIRALLDELFGLVAAGAISPLGSGLRVGGSLTPPPVETFPISRAAEAFRRMAQGQHLGKLVLTLDDPEVRIRAPAESSVAVRADGTYLVTGGLGGLGLRVAGWLAERGAGQLVLVGRSGAASAEQRAAVAALEAHGARVTVAKADVADRSQIERVLREVTASGMPLRGVVHAAGLVDDGLLMQQTPARLRTVMGPKVQGALHLHTLTREAPLSFFVLYASAAGLFGSPGQGNYAAANAFLDALSHHRRAHGLPALSIDWGMFTEVGMAVAQENRGARLISRGMRGITPDEGLSALARLLEGDRVQTGVIPITPRQWVEFYPATAASRRLSRLVTTQRAVADRTAGDRDLLEQLASAEPSARAGLLQDVVRVQVSHVLRLPEDKIEVDAPLSSMGMDSLMSLELRNRIEAALGVAAPAALGWTYPTVAAITRWLLDDALAVRLGGGSDTDESTASAGSFVHVLRFRPVVKPRARLFCFHGSGGSPEGFRSWSEKSEWSDLEIVAMWHDRSLASEDAPGKKYVQEAASLIQHYADAPFALVGFSLGVRFVMGTAVELASRSGAPAPLAVFALGGSLISSSEITPEMETDIIAKLFFRNAAGFVRSTQQVQADARADKVITDTMVAPAPGDSKEPPSKIAVPIVAIAGSDDVIVPPSDVQDLQSRTTERFYMHLLPGDHEFLVDRGREIMHIVDSHLNPLLAARTTSSGPAFEAK